MVKGIKLLFIVIISLLFTCEVTFDQELEEYIEDVAARKPLDLVIVGGVVIDELPAFNMGFAVVETQSQCTIVNNESRDIIIAEFLGVEGDFVIPPFESFVLKEGESFSFPVTYIPTVTFRERVSAKLVLKDNDGREFIFNIWGTSRRQPLMLYNLFYEPIKTFDLGNWPSIDRLVLLKNEGLEELDVQWIQLPPEIFLNSPSSFHMIINQEVILRLNYNSSGEYVYGLDNSRIRTNHSLETDFFFEIVAGGQLELEFGKSGVPLFNYTGFNSPAGEMVTETFYLKNNSQKLIRLTSSTGDNPNFNTDFGKDGKPEIQPGEVYEFNVVFNPQYSGVWWMDLYIRDEITNRETSIYFEGSAPL